MSVITSTSCLIKEVQRRSWLTSASTTVGCLSGIAIAMGLGGLLLDGHPMQTCIWQSRSNPHLDAASAERVLCVMQWMFLLLCSVASTIKLHRKRSSLIGMATENGHDHAHAKVSAPSGSLAGFDTLDALFQVIRSVPCHKRCTPHEPGCPSTHQCTADSLSDLSPVAPASRPLPCRMT